MRIGFVSTYPPIECGIATYTQDLNFSLKKLQLETFVLSQIGAQGKGVFPIYKPESASFVSDVFYTSTSMTPDIMHIQHEYGLYGSQRGIKVIELLLRYQFIGIPVVTTLHTVYSELDKQENFLLRYLINESAAVIVHEEFQKKTLEKQFGLQDKIHVIEHGIREVSPIPDAKAKLNLEGKKIILMCGYFRPSKGFHKIVDCFSQISSRDKDAVLIIAGKTRNIEYDDYRRELLSQISRSDVADRVVFLRGQFPSYTFDTIVSAADVVVLPYEKGAQSGILSQCVALGRPVVVSNLPAFRNFIQRSHSGLVCESDGEYVDKIVQVLNDQTLVKTFKANMERYIKEHSGWSIVAKRHCKVYESVTVPYGKERYIYFPEPENEKC
jgi:1,2-diacylglycerol 3-alpha-glucosyltransferase